MGLLDQEQTGLEEDQLDPADPLAQGQMVLRQVSYLKHLDLDQGQMNQTEYLLEDQLDPAELLAQGRLDPADDQLNRCRTQAEEVDTGRHFSQQAMLF